MTGDTPFTEYRTTVPEEWIDENDHMDTVHYKTAADGATRVLFAQAGLTREALTAHDGTLFQLEMHICFERELRLGDGIAVRSRIVGADAKRIHHIHEIVRERDDVRAATVELMTIHIDRTLRKSAPMPGEVAQRLAAMAEAHRIGGYPDKVASRIGLSR